MFDDAEIVAKMVLGDRLGGKYIEICRSNLPDNIKDKIIAQLLNNAGKKRKPTKRRGRI